MAAPQSEGHAGVHSMSASAPPTSLSMMPLALEPSSTPEPTLLTDLPIELRLNIYEHLFCFPEPIKLKLCTHGTVRQDFAHKVAPKVPVQAFRVSKEIYLEAAPVLYKCNKFSMLVGRLSNTITSHNQTYCRFLESLDIHFDYNSAWGPGYVHVTKYFIKCMPELRKLHFKPNGPLALMAASLEFSNAIMTCTPMPQTVSLQLCAQILRSEVILSKAVTPASANDVRLALMKENSKLAEILPTDKPHVGPLTHTDLGLAGSYQIHFAGVSSAVLLRKLEDHLCSMGECAWIKTHEDNQQEYADETVTGKRIHYRWERKGAPALTGTEKEVNMLQFYPGLSKREQRIYRDFFESYNGTSSAASASKNVGRDEQQQSLEETVEDSAQDSLAEDQFNESGPSSNVTPRSWTATSRSNASGSASGHTLNTLYPLTINDYVFDEPSDDFWDEQFGFLGPYGQLGHGGPSGNDGSSSNSGLSGNSESGFSF